MNFFPQIKSVLKNTPLLTIYRTYQRLIRNKEARKYQAENGGGYYCIGCGKYWKKFEPFPKEWMDILVENGWEHALVKAETLNFEKYSCYGCGMTDRDRLYAIYLSKIIKQSGAVSIVEFAPTKALSDFLNSFENVTHRTSDLFMREAADRLDIQNLYKYKDESFDIFICSHILEHVDDDIKAMRELFRIAKKGGFGIAMVPIIKGFEKTHEDPSIKDEKLRVKYFGQSDHVRQYAKKDFIARLESVGFDVKLLDVTHFGHEVFEKNGISPKSVLYIVNK